MRERSWERGKRGVVDERYEHWTLDGVKDGDGKEERKLNGVLSCSCKLNVKSAKKNH